MARPVARADSTRDQAVGGGGIGNAQQGFGEAEKQNSLLARQAIFVQKGIDAATFPAAGTRRLDEPGGKGFDAVSFRDAEARLCDQRLDQRTFLGQQVSIDRCAVWQLFWPVGGS